MTRQWPSADDLRPYRGKWVLILDTIVLCAHDGLPELIACSRATGLQTTSMFRVPLDPGMDER